MYHNFQDFWVIYLNVGNGAYLEVAEIRWKAECRGLYRTFILYTGKNNPVSASQLIHDGIERAK